MRRGLPPIERAFLDSDTRFFVAMSRISCPRSASCKIPLNRELKIAISTIGAALLMWILLFAGAHFAQTGKPLPHL